MLGAKKLKTISKKVLHLAKSADQAEVLLFSSSRALTRFANNEIHQNIQSQSEGVQIRVVLDKKIGVASTDRIDSQGLSQAVQRALENAKHQKQDPGFVSLPNPSKTYPKVLSFSAKTASQTPKQRAEAVATIVKLAKSAKLTASGAYDNKLEEIAITNSLGVWAYHKQSKIELSTINAGKFGAGWAEAQSREVDEIDPEKVGKQAIFRAVFGGEPKALKPGEYETILEPEAVFPFSDSDEFLGYFGVYAANARIFHEDVSILKGKLNKKIFSNKISLVDNPLDPDCLPMPFDYEGTAKKKLTFVDKGVAKKIAYDSYYANKYKKANTGHAMPAPNVWGPMPGHLQVAPGKQSKEEMIKSVKNGLLVCHLHYLRVLHHRDLLLTGMTKDGLFIIKNGELVGRANNMRYTESLPKIFSKVKGVGKETKKVRSLWGGIVKAPAIHFDKFNFSGTTKFS